MENWQILTLCNNNSGKLLTASSKEQLVVKGNNYYLVVAFLITILIFIIVSFSIWQRNTGSNFVVEKLFSQNKIRNIWNVLLVILMRKLTLVKMVNGNAKLSELIWDF